MESELLTKKAQLVSPMTSEFIKLVESYKLSHEYVLWMIRYTKLSALDVYGILTECCTYWNMKMKHNFPKPDASYDKYNLYINNCLIHMGCIKRCQEEIERLKEVLQ